MKTCYCVKCKAPFEMPDNYDRPILCEDCDPLMNPPKTYKQGLADGIAQGRREAAEAYCKTMCPRKMGNTRDGWCGQCDPHNTILGTSSKGEGGR